MNRSGFTLVELLVSLAIVTLLLAILLPALARGRKLAQHTVTMADMRQVMIGYHAHQGDNRGRVMLGYCPVIVDGRPLSVRLPSGHVIPDSTEPGINFPLISRYPVRMSPYLQGIWKMYYKPGESLDMPESNDSYMQAMSKAYVLSENPRFGINSVYVGGDLNFQGFGSGPNFARNTKRHVVFAAHEVKRPSELIVFAEAAMHLQGQPNGDRGYHRLTPPRAGGVRWQVSDGAFDVTAMNVVGLPARRNGFDTITGFFDGHVAAMSPEQLVDMRHWANDAASRDYDFNP